MSRFALILPAAAVLALLIAAPAVADSDGGGNVDDFTFSSFDATYELGLDTDGRSVLTVTETLVAQFPDVDQNRGIRRELVDSYDGHPTDLEVISVEDEAGTPREYESDGDDEFEVLTIAGDDFVRGEQTYVITYEQHNVTRYFENTDADEFYWDVNGTGWAQPFGRVTAEIVLAPELQEPLTGQTDAASGAEGETGPATITPADTGFTVEATDLGPGENLTFAIGFEPGTFVPRDDSFGAAPWPLASLIAALLAIAATVGSFVFRRRRLRDAPAAGPVVTEFLPPTDASVLLSSVISNTTGNATTAQILALAVAGNLRLVEVGGARKPKYRLEFLTDRGADADGREFLHAVFGAELTPGEGRDLEKSDEKAVTRISKLMSRVTADAAKNGYRRAVPVGPVVLVLAAAMLTGAAAFIFAVVSLASQVGRGVPVVFLLIGVLAILVSIFAVAKQPLDEKGVRLRDYLRGLKRYIEVAEADRIRFLQSPVGAERRRLDAADRSDTPRIDTSRINTDERIDPDDPAQLVQLNERLLPYAVLFGHEKRWVEELGRHYEQLGTQPGWYYGNAPFNAALFASSIGLVSSSVSSSYSSSSGGSGGGASSGGGGGGGGGGGV